MPLAIPGNPTAYQYTSTLNVCLWSMACESERTFLMPEKFKDGNQVYSPPRLGSFSDLASSLAKLIESEPCSSAISKMQ